MNECVNADTMQRKILGGSTIFCRESYVCYLLPYMIVYLKFNLVVCRFPCGGLIFQITLTLMRDFTKHSSIKIEAPLLNHCRMPPKVKAGEENGTTEEERSNYFMCIF